MCTARYIRALWASRCSGNISLPDNKPISGLSQLADSPKATSGNLPSNDEGVPGGILKSFLAASAPMASPVSLRRLTLPGISAIRSFVCEDNSPMPVFTEQELLEGPVEKLSGTPLIS